MNDESEGDYFECLAVLTEETKMAISSSASAFRFVRLAERTAAPSSRSSSQ
jgi:hypothetical protein